MKFAPALLVCLAAVSAACHPGPAIGRAPNQGGGTIAGVVKTADAAVAVPGRKITLIETTTGARHETTTAINGGYTIQVPRGTYRIEIELRPGETLAKQPRETRVNNSDLDSGRDFVITTRTSGRD